MSPGVCVRMCVPAEELKDRLSEESSDLAGAVRERDEVMRQRQQWAQEKEVISATHQTLVDERASLLRQLQDVRVFGCVSAFEHPHAAPFRFRVCVYCGSREASAVCVTVSVLGVISQEIGRESAQRGAVEEERDVLRYELSQLTLALATHTSQYEAASAQATQTAAELRATIDVSAPVSGG